MNCSQCCSALPFYIALSHGRTIIFCKHCHARLKPEPGSLELVTQRTGVGGVLAGGPIGGIALLIGLHYGAWLQAGLLMLALVVGVTGSSMLYAIRHLRFEPVGSESDL